MANVLGIGGLNTSSGTNKLIAAFGNDLVNVDTGTGYGLNISSSNNSEFESFLDSLFWQNFNHTPMTFDGSSWTRKHVAHTPKAKYLKNFGTRMYLGYVTVNSTDYPSRVMYSDLPEVDGAGAYTIQWGFMSGTNGVVTGGTNRFKAANAGFKTYNVKVGDPLIIESGANAGQYTIKRISDDQMVEILEEFESDQTSITYWAGSNWFDVKTDDSDVLMWLSENNDRLLAYKQDSLHRYDGNSLKRVRGPGTSSGRSVAYVKTKDINIYFHGSDRDATGFYLYDGTDPLNISRSVQPYIDAISASNYDNVVHWMEGDIYRAYCGDIDNDNSSNSAYNIDIDKAVFSYSIPDNKWSIDPIADVIRCTGKFRESGKQKFYLGNSESEVLTTNSGYNFNGEPINMVYETQPIYPRGSVVRNVFTRVEIVSRDAAGVEVGYKLWGKPYGVDQQYRGLGNLKNDITELVIPDRHSESRGIQFNFYESSTTQPTPTIEKITVYSYASGVENPEIGRQ